MEAAQYRPSAAPPLIEIASGKNQMTIRSPELFGHDREQSLRTLIVSLFQSVDVHAVAIDRQNSSIRIDYDGVRLTPEIALREFARLLSDAEVVNAAHPLIREYLDRIPFPVKKIARHVVKSPGGVITPTSTNATLLAENLIVEYDVEGEGEFEATLKVKEPETVLSSGTLPADVTKPWSGEIVVGGVRRLVYLTAAGGCLLLSVVGVVTPGIPTVPFVLATGYFLARSSPRLHERLRHSRLFGKMLSDYEDYGGITPASKRKAILISVGLILLTLAIAQPSIPLVILISFMGGVSFYLINRIPTLQANVAMANG